MKTVRSNEMEGNEIENRKVSPPLRQVPRLLLRSDSYPVAWRGPARGTL